MNKKKLQPSVPQALREGDEVCFGTAIPNNVFKYTFTLRDGKHLLSRKRKRVSSQESNQNNLCNASKVKLKVGMAQVSDSETDATTSQNTQNSETILNPENDLDLTPPLRKNSRLHEEDTGASVSILPSSAQVLDEQHAVMLQEGNEMISVSAVSSSSGVPQTVPPLVVSSHQMLTSSRHSSPSVSNTIVLARTSISEITSCVIASTPLQSSPSSSTLCSAKTTTPLFSYPSPLVSLSSNSAKPSPAVSCTSTEVDDLFDSIVKRSDSTLLDEAIFGGKESSKPPFQTSGKSLDGATIQVMVAKNEMEQEKHHLLCSIAALKSELAAKNDVITKKEDDEKEAKEGVVTSMKEEFTCVICQELFIRPHTLPCSHTFCEWCIKNWFKSRKLECPICRVKTVGQPVKSIVLHNAIAMLEEKLIESEREEREQLKKDREKFLQVQPVQFTPKSGGAVVISDYSHTSGASDNPIVLNETSESESSSESESESEETDDSEARRNSHYYLGYGGYGRCYSCGKATLDIECV